MCSKFKQINLLSKYRSNIIGVVRLLKGSKFKNLEFEQNKTANHLSAICFSRMLLQSSTIVRELGGEPSNIKLTLIFGFLFQSVF